MAAVNPTNIMRQHPQPGLPMFNSHQMGVRATDKSSGRPSATKRTHADIKMSAATSSVASAPAAPLPKETASVANTTSTNLEPQKKKRKNQYPALQQTTGNGHFYVALGDDVDVDPERPDDKMRFKILDLLGEGTFGKVVEAWDRKKERRVAVKIVRNVPKYTRDAEMEIHFMQCLAAADQKDEYPFVKVTETFTNKLEHMCIVMPMYGKCLLDHMRAHGGFTLSDVAKIAYQLGKGLHHLHEHVNMMHTDLKPENILLESRDVVPVTGIPGIKAQPRDAKIRICDMGGCTDELHSALAIVSTRHYRAPEIILGTGWMYAADMWSVGCILYELFTTKLLYSTRENREHLAMMQQTLGELPRIDPSLIAHADVRVFFDNKGTLIYPAPDTTEESIRNVQKAKPIERVISDALFLDLLRRLLDYNKETRMTARELCGHPFITQYYPEAQQDPLNPQLEPVVKRTGPPKTYTRRSRVPRYAGSTTTSPSSTVSSMTSRSHASGPAALSFPAQLKNAWM